MEGFMKKLIFGFAFILVASIIIITVQANARPFACTNGIIKLGDSAATVKKKCKVISKDGSHWTVKGKFKNTAVVTIQRGKVTIINK